MHEYKGNGTRNNTARGVINHENGGASNMEYADTPSCIYIFLQYNKPDQACCHLTDSQSMHTTNNPVAKYIYCNVASQKQHS